MNKVVLIDDEFWILKGIEKTFDFEAYGFEVALSTTKPREAISYVIEHDVEVVFVDIKMSGITGFEVIDSIKDGGKEPLFIIVSGFDDYEFMRSAIQHKVFDYCLKPVTRENAEKVLENLRGAIDGRNYADVSISGVKDIDNANFLTLIEYINSHYQDKLLLKEIADMFFYNPNYLCMLFNKYFGMTYSQYLLCLRMEKAHDMINNKKQNPYDVALSVGFQNFSYFKKKYVQYWGEAPVNS